VPESEAVKLEVTLELDEEETDVEKVPELHIV